MATRPTHSLGQQEALGLVLSSSFTYSFIYLPQRALKVINKSNSNELVWFKRLQKLKLQSQQGRAGGKGIQTGDEQG